MCLLFLALVLLGVLRWKVSKESMWRSIGEVVLVGGTSAVVAFGVGMLLGGRVLVLS